MQHKHTYTDYSVILAAVLVLVFVPAQLVRAAQFDVDGDFRLRWYSDRFSDTRDNHGDENYMRYLGHIRAKARVNPKTQFYTELITWTQNNTDVPARNIAGTGRMNWGINQIFAELVEPRFLVFDLFRARVGRQQFPIGEGLTQGESSYFSDKFDAIRFDMSWRAYVFSVFGSITGQNLSASGLYPDPGSDQLYIARLSRAIGNHTVMGYYVYNKLRNDYNDSYIFGGGLSGNFLKTRLTYFGEIAFQDYHTLEGLPQRGGMGYMFGASYRWAFGPFKSVKFESKYAAYQGDDTTTTKVEIFSPLYPSFFWGSRVGYVDGSIGGDYPFNGRNPEGTRIWYTRFYVVPTKIPQLRVQFQVVLIEEYVDNDGYNTQDDEFSIKAYYTLSPSTQLQFRFAHNYPNGDDKDLNQSGVVSFSEDRSEQTRFMLELRVKF